MARPPRCPASAGQGAGRPAEEAVWPGAARRGAGAGGQPSTAKAIEDRGLKPALQPRVDLKGVRRGQGRRVRGRDRGAAGDRQLDFSGIELERLKAVVPDKDVDEALQRIAKANREQKPVDPPRPAQKGDALKLDFVGSVDGTEFPGGTAQDYSLEIGSGSFIPGFEDQLVGAEAGKTVDVKVTFPGDYGSADLAGKDAVFKCTIKEVLEFVDKPIDDEFRQEETTSKTSRPCARR
jgi:trigger factor